MPRDQKQFHNYFMKKYKTLYNSVPTSHSDLSNIKNTLVERLHPSEVANLDHVTPELICPCIGKLNQERVAKDSGLITLLMQAKV